MNSELTINKEKDFLWGGMRLRYNIENHVGNVYLDNHDLKRAEMESDLELLFVTTVLDSMRVACESCKSVEETDYINREIENDTIYKIFRNIKRRLENGKN